MANTRAFKNLASLRNSFDTPFAEEETVSPALEQVAEAPVVIRAAAAAERAHIHAVPPLTPVTGKVDRRRLRKVLKTPSVSLSVAVRAELHAEISEMLFARKSTWIALLDELLTAYVSEAKATRSFPK
jgi:hypothetical protein